MKIKLTILFATLLTVNVALSQIINPVTVTTTLTPPHSALLPDYSSIGSNKLVASIVLNDLSEPSWDVRLKITIESNQIRISTKPNFKPVSPITLLPGTAVNISGEDLEPYLNYNNIDVAGISMSDLQQNGKLPEGYYTFTVEVYDYASSRLLSNSGSAGAFLQLNGVPIVQTPAQGTVVVVQDPVNIQFQWQLSTPSFYGNPNDIEYQLSLYKILDPNVEPQNSIINNVVEQIYQSDFSPNTTTIYGITEPPLEIGQKYSYTIQARDVQERDIFKNDGFSEVGWFNYGYPTGGTVNLISPENGKSFTLNEFKRFQWEAPDNTLENQQIYYHVKIVELQGNQDTADAIANNDAWYEQTTTPQINSFGGDFMLNDNIENQKAYAWRVTAHTGDQEIAKSPVYQFIGPPLIEWFWAGNHKVFVTRTFNDDLNNLSGKGKVKIDPDGTMYEFTFDSLQIVNSGGENTLMNGTLYSDSINIDDIELSPNYTDNGKAYFHTEALRLDKDELAIKGVVTWAFPHAVNSTDPPQVVSKVSWINYDVLKLNGKANLSADNKFDLIDPANFRLELDTISDFFITDNKYTERFYGNVFLPENIKDANNNRVSLHFNYVSNLYYFTNENITKSNNILLVPNTGILLNPKDITVDLSETQSPQRFSGNLEWKGIYLNNFNIVYQTNVDANGQMVLDQTLSQNFVLDNSAQTNAWITYEGLDLKVEHDFAQNSMCKFNTFESLLTQSKIVIVQSSLQEGYLKGTVKVPFLKDDEDMAYTLPLSAEGFQHGYLNDDFQNFTVELNPDKEKLHITMTVKQATFTDNERLELVVDLDWPGIQCLAENINGLSIWGDQNIGFGERNGKKVLENQLTGLYENTYDITIDSLVATKMYNDYLIGYIGNIVLSEDISGENGPTRFVVGATKTVSQNLPNTAIEPPQILKDFIVNTVDFVQNGEINITVPYFYLYSPAVILYGKLKIMHNNPDWGTAFYASVNAQLLKPKRMDLGAIFLLGKKDGTPYWFAELSMNKEEEDSPTIPGVGMSMNALQLLAQDGIPVGPVSITSMIGRVYHHMSAQTPVGVNCNMDFSEIDDPGAILNVDMGQLIDLPDIPDLDICSILNYLDNSQKRDLLDQMSKEEFYAILETMSIDDMNSIREYILNHDPTATDAVNTLMIAYGLANNPDDFNYARIARLFPNIDWNDKLAEDNYGGFQWSDFCNLDLHWPSIPSLCDMSEYVLNKVLGELPPPDYQVLEDLDPDVDWGVIEAEYPEANWPSLREFFPDGGLCNLVMQYPNIDWGYIYLHVPELPRLPWPIDWRKYIPSIPNINLSDLLPDISLPDINIPDLSMGNVEVDYDVNPDISYGGYLFVAIKDNATKGITMKAKGTLEMAFNNSGGLDNLGLKLESTHFNIPGGTIDPFARSLGCLSYTSEHNQFVGDFFAEVHNPTMCAHGNLHFDASDDGFHVNLASRENPVIIQPFCGFGPTRWEGFFSFDPNQLAVGLGVTINYGLHVSFTPIDGCNLHVNAEMGYYAKIYAAINYSPDFYLEEAEFRAGFHAGLSVGTSGILCGNHDFTIASVALDGMLRYKHSPNKNISGAVSGEANFLDIVTADVDFDVNINL